MIETVPLQPLATPSFSLWNLFTQADIIVKVVMIILICASVWSWAIIFSKYVRLKRLAISSRIFETHFWRSKADMGALYEQFGRTPRNPFAAIFGATVTVWQRFAEKEHTTPEAYTLLKERLEHAMESVAIREMARLEHRIDFLSSLGATAPFIGLFGTVWGIMNSFEAIAVAQNTSLTVVAPAIAEALFATALGLIAAIPAVIAYNKIAVIINRYHTRLEAFSKDLLPIVLSQLTTKRR